MIKVSRAIHYDLFHLEALIRQAQAESNGYYPGPKFPEAYHSALNIITMGLAFVAIDEEAEEGGKIVGCLMMDTKKWHWNPDVVYLESVHYYVMPHARNKKTEDGRIAAVALLDAGKAIADAAGTSLIVQVLNPVSADRKTAFIEHNGFENMGGNMVYHPAKQEAAQAA